MKNKTLWIVIIIVLAAAIFFSAFLFKGDKLPWNKDQDVTIYVPPVGEILPTATFFSPSVVTPTSKPNLVWVDPDLPDLLLQQLAEMDFLEITDQKENASTTLVVGDENPLLYWVYAAVAPFPTIADGISLDQIQSAWQGGKNPLAPSSPILMSQETRDVLSKIWGEPDLNAIDVINPDRLSSQAWSQQPSLAILPFEDLSPDWKVLEVDSISPLQQEFDPVSYGLSIPISAVGFDPNIFQEVTSNRDPDKFTSVVLTGVTALVRATAWTMEVEGINYPARDILRYLKEADILHISNEVPFMQGCAYPDPGQKGLRFCSDRATSS